MQKLILSLIIGFIILSLLPLSFDKTSKGMYNTTSQLMWCTDEDSCIHEFVHHMDDQLDWPSQNDEFRQAVQIYMLVELQSGNTENVQRILGHSNIFSNSFELYAGMFSYYYKHQDEIPPQFEEYIDFSMIDDLGYEEGGIYWLIGSNKYKITS